MSDRPLLAVEAVSKSYSMGRTSLSVLRGCTFDVREGEFVAIMGKSGSGKSTLLHILGALDVPQKGQVVFDGRPVFADERSRRLRASIVDAFSTAERRRISLRRHDFGFVFQFYHLLPELNVLENVLLPRMVSLSVRAWFSRGRAARADAVRIIERVGLSERIKHRPNELSGGERQRVALARALVHSPRVLLADEPTGNLDAETGQRLMKLLRGLHREGQTIVMVTHDVGMTAYADRVLELHDGGLRARETEPRP